MYIVQFINTKFGLCCRLSQVCENWRKLILCTPLLWQRLDLSGLDDRFPFVNFQRLNEDNALFSCVKELDLNGWSGINAERIIEIVAESSNFELELLNVKNCRNISGKFLETVVQRCPNLKKFDFSAVTVWSSFYELTFCFTPFALPFRMFPYDYLFTLLRFNHT